MPMNFPDMKSLAYAAECWKFRKVNEGESEQSYRSPLADFVAPKDLVESQEIRTKVGWNQWDENQGTDLVMRKVTK